MQAYALLPAQMAQFDITTVLLDYVIQVFALTDFHTSMVVIIELINTCFIGTTFVDID